MTEIQHCPIFTIDKVGLDSWAQGQSDECSVSHQDQKLKLLEPLRHLPGKRLTCVADLSGRKVVAKFFYDAHHKKNALREKQGLDDLRDAGIKAPEVLYFGADHQQSGHLLLIEYLDKAITLKAKLDDPLTSVSETILKACTRLFAALHNSNLCQLDPHLENFLVVGTDLWAIDPGQLDRRSNGLGGPQALENLALFFAQFPVFFDQYSYQYLREYRDSRTMPFELPDSEGWSDLLLKQRQWRQKRFIDKKVFRTCSQFKCEQSSSRFLVASRSVWSDPMQSALEAPDLLIEQGVLLKDGGTATVASVEIDHETYALKRYNIKKPVHALIRGLIWSRAAVSWRNGHLLNMLGIATPRPLVLIENRVGKFRRKSYLLTEYMEAEHAEEFFDSVTHSEALKREVAGKVSRIFQVLASNRIIHGDLKPMNILISGAEPVLIDLDALRSIPSASKTAFEPRHQKDVSRFFRDWSDKARLVSYFSDTPWG